MLKTLALSLIAIASVSAAHASALPTAADSWETILRNRYVLADFAQIAFGSHFVPVANVCLDGETLRTIAPVRVCASYEHGGLAGNICSEETYANLATALTFTAEACDVYNGLSNACEGHAVTYSHALSYNVDVYLGAASASMGGNRDVLFTKAFTIANCQ